MEAPLRVLLVDDHPLLREAIRDALAEEGFEVAEAASGADALEAVESLRPAVVVLDVRLPDADGAWTMREIRHRHPDVAVVMRAAFPSEEETALLLSEGASACLSKEAPFEEWGRTIRDALPSTSRVAASAPAAAV